MALTLKQKISSVGYLLTHPKALQMILSMKEFGYLSDEGWFSSLNSGESVDKFGEPIPWFTYPAIDFLKERLNKNMTVFEYGSGSSTLFFANRVKEIISFETDRSWFEKVKSKLPPNASIILFDENNSAISYPKVIDPLNKKFDIIIVDAIERNEVLLNSINYLKEDGVVILDNSDRDEYRNTMDELKKFHFKRIDFWGIQAAYLNKTCTTIFYKSENCLGI
ncbi:hypothetical protein [Ignavibacterium sp.]|uniref:hypothetical protein n=1 Tax=Ignavibacterium sp. TaxID=2651167 RepID=UPI00307FC7CE